MILHFMRHASSEANRLDILAGRIDYPLSEEGRAEAAAVARAFLAERSIDAIISSPLVRARQTAEAFARETGLPVELDAALVEQDMGVFAGKTYAEVEVEPGYERDKGRRWDWTPEGGESYRAIAERLGPFFSRLEERMGRRSGDLPPERILVVSHAVTLRLVVAHLEASLPDYPTALLRNAEILTADFRGLGAVHGLSYSYFGDKRSAKA